MSESLEDEKLALEELLAMLEKETGEKADDFFKISLANVAYSMSQMVRKRVFDEAEWKGVYVGPYLASFVGKPSSDALSTELRKRWMEIEKVSIDFVLTFPYFALLILF